MLFACRNGNGSHLFCQWRLSCPRPFDRFNHGGHSHAPDPLVQADGSALEGQPVLMSNCTAPRPAKRMAETTMKPMTGPMVAPPAGSDGSSVGGSHDGSHGGLDVAGAGEPYVEPNGASHVASDGASYGRPLHRIDDSIIVVGIDGSLAPSAREYALALIEHLQGHAVLREHWISSKALELEFYPEFLDASGWPPLPGLAISKVLKTVTKKRTKHLILFKDGKRARRCIVQFKIPRPASRR